MKIGYFSRYPAIAEIALTYRCQNRCDICLTSGKLPRNGLEELSTDQIKRIIDKLSDEAKIHTVYFTGGEPAIRPDLPEIIRYTSEKGLGTTLITNGIKCSEKGLVKTLSDAGLHSAHVSLESDDELVHNRITGNIESFRKTVAGIHNLKEAGIDTVTTTTICRWNRDGLIPLVKFLKNEFNAASVSLNMTITADTAWNDDHAPAGYSSLAATLIPVRDYCERFGMKLIWSSAAPYCIFNPADYNIESEQTDGLSSVLSINPGGDIIPCHGHSRVIGNILADSFENLWNSDTALYFREKRYFPPVCKNCGMKPLCAGASPLYWMNTVTVREIEKRNRKGSVTGVISHLLGKITRFKKNKNSRRIRDGSSLSLFQ